MKIKEVLAEGVVGTIGSMAGAAVGGVAKGLLDVASPEMVDRIKKVRHNARKVNSNPAKLGNITAPADTAPIATDSPQQSSDPLELPKVVGFTVMDHDPIRIEYKGVDYTLNNDSEWVTMSGKGTQKPLVKDTNPTLERLLDRAAGFEQTAAIMSQEDEPAVFTSNRPLATVKSTIGTAIKRADGKWYVKNNPNPVTKPEDIAKLDQEAKATGQLK